MTTRMSAARALTLSVAAAAAALAFAASVAEPVTEVIVEAPKITHTGDRAPPLGTPIDIASIRYRVSYGDLNLATPAGAKTLEERVNDAARQACKQLEASLPPNAITPVREAPCVKTAVDGAMRQVREAVAAAGKPTAK